jgi:hypothetical protein
MKDETHGIAIQEFVGLKSKMYSMIYEEEGCLKEKKTTKGLRRGSSNITPSANILIYSIFIFSNDHRLDC